MGLFLSACPCRVSWNPLLTNWHLQNIGFVNWTCSDLQNSLDRWNWAGKYLGNWIFAILTLFVIWGPSLLLLLVIVKRHSLFQSCLFCQWTDFLCSSLNWPITEEGRWLTCGAVVQYFELGWTLWLYLQSDFLQSQVILYSQMYKHCIFSKSLQAWRTACFDILSF